MPDTAEYWFDVKSKRTSNMFRHAKGVICGHNHNTKDTEYIDDVECHACIKIIKEGNTANLLNGKAPETYYMSKIEKKLYNKRKAFILTYGKCDCGANWKIRENKEKKIQFLGCANYPNCKKTKSL
jgi:ssDNA-binding Zn-finger/Zn-ribbon topoisomerase 1